MESDDDLYLVEYLERAEEAKSDCLLFARPDGLPMAFVDLDCDIKTSEKIKAHGGIVVDCADERFKENAINICSHNGTYDISEDTFDKLFIYDSLRSNKIGKLIDYRLNKSIQFGEVEYDPLDILLGYQSWNDVKTFTEFEEDEECPSPMIRMSENDRILFDDCGFEQTGLLQTEDEIWEARTPDQVYVSQNPEVEPVKIEDHAFESGIQGRNDDKLFIKVEKEDEKSLYSKIGMNENNQVGNCGFEQTVLFQTEDEIWEARTPSQVYDSQNPEVGLVGSSDLKIEDHDFESENPEFASNSVQDVPHFVRSLLRGKFISNN